MNTLGAADPYWGVGGDYLSIYLSFYLSICLSVCLSAVPKVSIQCQPMYRKRDKGIHLQLTDTTSQPSSRSLLEQLHLGMVVKPYWWACNPTSGVLNPMVYSLHMFILIKITSTAPPNPSGFRPPSWTKFDLWVSPALQQPSPTRPTAAASGWQAACSLSLMLLKNEVKKAKTHTHNLGALPTRATLMALRRVGHARTTPAERWNQCLLGFKEGRFITPWAYRGGLF